MSRYLSDSTGELIWKRVFTDIAVGIFGLFFALELLFGTWFTIQQTDMGNVRRMGHRLYEQPLGAGLHFKMPFMDTVDTIRVTLNTVVIEPFDVSTIDNQIVTLTVNYNYTIPANEVNHLLYEVGGMGDDNKEIHNQAIAVTKDRASAVFAGQNMVSVNANRAQIQDSIAASVHQKLHELFGLDSHSLQLPMIQPSKAFMDSNIKAVNAKNDAVAAENQKRTIQFQADQQVIAATGAANSVKAKADGDAYSVKVSADAEQYRLTAEAKGQAAQVSAFGSAANYIELVKVQTWKGELPQYMGAGQPIPFLNLAKP